MVFPQWIISDPCHRVKRSVFSDDTRAIESDESCVRLSYLLSIKQILQTPARCKPVTISGMRLPPTAPCGGLQRSGAQPRAAIEYLADQPPCTSAPPRTGWNSISCVRAFRQSGPRQPPYSKPSVAPLRAVIATRRNETELSGSNLLGFGVGHYGDFGFLRRPLYGGFD